MINLNSDIHGRKITFVNIANLEFNKSKMTNFYYIIRENCVHSWQKNHPFDSLKSNLFPKGSDTSIVIAFHGASSNPGRLNR